MKYLLLALAAAVNLLPEWLADHVGGRVTAWEYCAWGLEAAALWGFVIIMVGGSKMQRELRYACVAVAIWGALEGFARAACRLALPMDLAVPKGQPLCNAAFGFQVSSFSLVIVGALIALVAHECRRK